MKIVLAFPKMDGPESTASSLSTSEHLGMGYLAATLRSRGHDVLVINAEVQQIDNSEILKRIILFDPILVGCSPVSLSIINTLTLIKNVKLENSNIKTLLGGHLATMCALDIMKNEHYIDFILKGDAEYSIVDLLNKLEFENDLQNVSGIIYRTSNGIIGENLLQLSPIDLDTLPFCERDDLEYISEHPNFDRSARLLASRGCYYKCSFCTTPSFYGNNVRARSPYLVVDEMNFINERFAVTHFWFNDDLFVNGTPENTSWIKEFTSILKANTTKYSYRVLCRADSFRPNNIEILDDLVESGLTHIFFGLESGSQHSLDIYNKKITVAKNKSAVELLKTKKIELQIGFIMFNPYSTFDDIEESVLFLYEIDELYRLYPLTKSLSVFPGTPISAKLLADGLLISNSYKEPLTCYKYKDEKIAYTADLLAEIYNNYFPLDNNINRAIKGLRKSEDHHDLKKILSVINRDRCLTLISQIKRRDFIDKKADLAFIILWMEDLQNAIKVIEIKVMQ